MDVIEQRVTSKAGLQGPCEDGIVVTPHHAAVIDGATDKSCMHFEGVSGGQFAMQACAQAIANLAPDADASTAVQRLTETLRSRLPDKLSISDRPSAVVAIYSAQRREIWRVGDVSIWYDGMSPRGGAHQNRVDFYASGVRAAVLTAELISGRTVEELRGEDYGRAAILPLLVRQGVFANNPDAGEWAYGAINGNPVPESLVETYPIPEGARTVILASDGYPLVLPTLDETEKQLHDLLREDPLCIGPLKGTKGVRPGAESYDDRSYLRLAVS
ncbi:hypothetical protein [Streptomyces eurythermus]|uniref:hypothetical protein n=1 Tax=Streptomyces eurythermus TaxID=42237 RepID=UPI0036F66989